MDINDVVDKIMRDLISSHNNIDKTCTMRIYEALELWIQLFDETDIITIYLHDMFKNS